MPAERTLGERIAARDPGVAAGFFDGHAAGVRRYCEELTAPERLDEATLAAFVEFLGRVAAAPPDADPVDLLRKATRSAAAGRAEIRDPREPACRAIAELLAARANGELAHDERPLQNHLKRCRACRALAERFAVAEEGWIRPAAEAPPEHVRTAWLGLIAPTGAAIAPTRGATSPTGAAIAPTRGATSPTGAAIAPTRGATSPTDTATAPPRAATAPPPAPLRVRRRTGGLLGAARRLAASRRRDQ